MGKVRGNVCVGPRSATEAPLFAGRFRLLGVAAQGGMGVVHRAIDCDDGSVVAVKVPRDPGWAFRFQREVELLASLDCPGVVRYRDSGVTDTGVPWVAMEWLEGEDLATRLERGPLTVEEVRVLGHRLSATLAYAKYLGIVHRDIKPSNIFLPGGRIEEAKVLDFGIARSDDLDDELTETGRALGTAAYIAPEQAHCARSAGPEADVYSLGVVLYECLTGRLPFNGPTAIAIVAAALTRDAPRLREWGDFPVWLEDIVMSMIKRDPSERPAIALIVFELGLHVRALTRAPEAVT